MNEPYCRCPGYGDCGGSAKAKKLHAENKKLREEKERIMVLLAGIITHRHVPLAPHHTNAIREFLGDRTDKEIVDILLGEEKL